MEAMGDSCGGTRDVCRVGRGSGLTSVVETGPGTTAGVTGAGAAWLGLLDLEGGGEKGAGTLG